MRKVLILMIAMFAFVTASAQALPFWYNNEEIATLLTKVFQTTEVNTDNFLALDQAGIGNSREAKLLAAVLTDVLRPEQKILAKQFEAIEAKYENVDRYFNILYCKEIHDELWHQTREAKQNAYRKVHGELRGMVDSYKVLKQKVDRLEAIRMVLKKISRKFKEIK